MNGFSDTHIQRCMVTMVIFRREVNVDKNAVLEFLSVTFGDVIAQKRTDSIVKAFDLQCRVVLDRSVSTDFAVARRDEDGCIGIERARRDEFTRKKRVEAFIRSGVFERLKIDVHASNVGLIDDVLKKRWEFFAGKASE